MIDCSMQDSDDLWADDDSFSDDDSWETESEKSVLGNEEEYVFLFYFFLLMKIIVARPPYLKISVLNCC